MPQMQQSKSSGQRCWKPSAGTRRRPRRTSVTLKSPPTIGMRGWRLAWHSSGTGGMVMLSGITRWCSRAMRVMLKHGIPSRVLLCIWGGTKRRWSALIASSRSAQRTRLPGSGGERSSCGSGAMKRRWRALRRFLTPTRWTPSPSEDSGRQMRRRAGTRRRSLPIPGCSTGNRRILRRSTHEPRLLSTSAGMVRRSNPSIRSSSSCPRTLLSSSCGGRCSRRQAGTTMPW